MQETRGSSGSGGDGAKSQASKPSPSSVPNVSSDNNNEGGEAPKFRGRPTTRGRRHPGAFATPEAIAAAIKSANELFEQCQQRKRAKEAEAAEAAKKSVDEQNIQQQQRQQEQKANSSESILDRQNRATAAVLTRFREMVKAVTEPLPKNGAILEAAKLNVLEMQTQTAAFVSRPSFSSILPISCLHQPSPNAYTIPSLLHITITMWDGFPNKHNLVFILTTTGLKPNLPRSTQVANYQLSTQLSDPTPSAISHSHVTRPSSLFALSAPYLLL